MPGAACLRVAFWAAGGGHPLELRRKHRRWHPRYNLQYMDNDKRRDLITAWKLARATGRSQRNFCKDHGITDRTLRAWLASEGQPRVSVRQAEVVLRRIGRHLLQVAEQFSSSQPDLSAIGDVGSPPDVASDFDFFSRPPDVEPVT